MIIAQDVLRWVVVKALRGRTWAKERVYDSPATPADIRIANERGVFVAVYTDEADAIFGARSGDDFSGSNSWTSGGAWTVKLLIEVASTGEETLIPNVPGQDNDPSDPDKDVAPEPDSAMTLAQTDESLEAVIGFIMRQVSQALLSTDNPWAELFRTLALVRRTARVRRGGPGQEQRENEVTAVRFASRIVEMEVEVLDDPVFGEQVPQGFWADFLALASGDSEMAGIAGLVRAHIEGTPGGLLPSWRIDQKRMAITQKGVTAIGIAPLPQVQSDEAEPDTLTQVTATDEAIGGPSYLIDEESEG